MLFGSRTVHAKPSQFFPVNVLGNLLRLLGTLVSGLIFPSLAMSGISVRFVLFIKDLECLSRYLTREAALSAANTLVGSCV